MMSAPKKTAPRLKLGIRYLERKNNPPPGLAWRRLEKDESLVGVAAEYGIRPVDLALYNWHTSRDEEINWYLYHFVGCRAVKGNWYVFSASSDKDKGWILVPDYPPEIKKGPPKSIDAVRNGAAKLDSKLQVHVVEWLANGDTREVSGKWLYVFSGQSGINFGFAPPPPPPPRDAGPDGQPESAFQKKFPGYFYLKEKPDRLEYEIYVSGENGPGSALLTAAAGKGETGKPRFEYGNNWYVLSDPAVLQRATTESRANRTTHASRKSKTVSIDLAPDGQNKRFYFLLSPVQLGPQALSFAMNNPAGLVPLIKPVADDGNWSVKALDPNLGLTPDDVKANPITLRVFDPYSWAENIAGEVFQDNLEAFTDWIGSKRNETIKALSTETRWPTLDHLYVAQILKAVRDNHPDPDSIDDELNDAGAWKKSLELWEKELFQRHAELNAGVHRILVQLIEWLDSPAHAIIETAILKDTTSDSPQDAVDVGWGILHWASCTEKMFALEPGVVFLQEILKRQRAIPYDLVLKHFKDLDKDTFAHHLSDKEVKGFRYAYEGVLSLLALYDFVAPPPVIAAATRGDYLLKLAEYNRKKRENLMKFFNDLQIIPAKVQAPAALPGLPGSIFNYSVLSTALNSSLDLVDKFTTYVIDPQIQIPRNGWILNKLADLEEWFEKRPRFAKFSNQGSSYALKVAAVAISTYNLYKAVTTARYDYQRNQSTVSALDWASAAAGSALAVQDVLAEIAALSGRALPQRLFPQLMVTASGPKWGVGAAKVVGVAGRTFARVNVVAMFISGVTTAVTMNRGAMAADGRGDYTAGVFYKAGLFGALAMAAGAVYFGYALMQAGGAAAATGVGATVGTVLFFVGGLVAAIGTIFGSLFSSDDFQIFARKCFLGVESDIEPRFSVKIYQEARQAVDPPEWSHASKTKSNSWPIEKQKRAIINLLGRFTLKTKPVKLEARKDSFQGTVEFEITTGLFGPGSTIEILLQYKSKAGRTAFRAEWNPGAARFLGSDKGEIFDAENSNVEFYSSDRRNVRQIKVWAENLRYEKKKGALLTTVSIRFPNNDINVIRTRKAVIEPDDGWLSRDRIEGDDNEETSAIFE
jgi:hypothetical protein